MKAKEIAIDILRNTYAPGNGGYECTIGPPTYGALISLITDDDPDYCKIHGHIKHAELNICICCHENI